MFSFQLGFVCKQNMEDNNNESPKKKKMATTPVELRKKYEDVIAYGADHPSEIPKKLHELRKLILLEGMPPETDVRTRKWT